MKNRKLINVSFILAIFCTLLLPINIFKVKADGNYKLVNFNTKGDATTHFYEDVTGKEGYTNGAYGADAIYLGEDSTRVKFKLSGVVGWVNKNEVEIIDMNSQKAFDTYWFSSYKVVDGSIKHYISKSVYKSTFGIVNLGPNNIGLASGVYYLSYDGHYFYSNTLSGFKNMVDDYRNGVNNHAVNSNKPYYSYYEYLTHRTQTNYSALDIENYIKLKGYTSKVQSYNTMTSTQSQLYGEGNSFINAQNTYGVNAIMSLGVAINESAFGRSNIAVTKNNLFGHQAYDINPGTNASKYSSVTASINYHAKSYISEGFMDPNDYQFRYNGGHFGTKASGINIKYASDPYWGEKAASYYYEFDKTYGYQDFGTKLVGIKTGYDTYNIYKEPTRNSNLLYTTTTSNDYSVVILDEVTGESINGNNKWYKIQADPTLSSDRTSIIQDNGLYNFNNNYAYIHSSAISLIIKNGQAVINKTYNITFNANGGVFSDASSSKVVTINGGVTPEITNPTREGYTFDGWDKTLSPALANTTYNAKWIVNKYNVVFDANGGMFEDSTSKKTLSIEYNSIPSITSPVKEGYEFIGWDKQISKVTTSVTYTAQWKQVKVYNITFNANGGIFSNTEDKLTVKVNQGTIPSVSIPTKDGYVFDSWSPTLTEASEDTTYRAIWRKGTVEDYLVKKDSEFYLEYLKEVNGQLEIKGYNTIKGIDNNLSEDIKYELVLVNQTTNKEYSQYIDRLVNEKEMSIPVYSIDGKDYKYSWFKSSISFENIDEGDYTLFIRSSNDKYYSKSYVQNILLNEQDTEFKTTSKYVTITNNYMDKNIPIEFVVRKNKIGTKETDFDVNQYSLINSIKIVDNRLQIVGASYSVGLDMRSSANLKREIVFENIDTFKQYRYSVDSLSKAIYPIKLINADKFGVTKDKAWFNKTIDIPKLEKGTYAIYVTNKSNISDYGELYDVLFTDLANAKGTIDGKEYKFVLNEEKRNRIELIVK